MLINDYRLEKQKEKIIKQAKRYSRDYKRIFGEPHQKVVLSGSRMENSNLRSQFIDFQREIPACINEVDREYYASIKSLNESCSFEKKIR